MAMSAVLLSRTRTPRPHLQQPANPKPVQNSVSFDIPITRRLAILTTFTLSTTPFIHSSSASAESFLSGISNTKSWFQFYGDGFAIRVPPQFQDIMEPEDYNVGLSLYGDKAKPKTFAARFASPDGMPKLICIDPQVPIFKKAGEVVLKIMGRTQIKAFPLVGPPFPSYWSDLRRTINEIDGAFFYFSSRYDDGIETRSEVLSVVIRPSNQLKITFLEAKDIADLGSLKEAAKIFVPGGTTLYSARTIKIKEEEGYRNYYFYEFGNDVQHAALVAAVNSGKAFIAGATAPHNKWNDDGVRLRSAAVSLTVL